MKASILFLTALLTPAANGFCDQTPTVDFDKGVRGPAKILAELKGAPQPALKSGPVVKNKRDAMRAKMAKRNAFDHGVIKMASILTDLAGTRPNFRLTHSYIARNGPIAYFCFDPEPHRPRQRPFPSAH